MCFCNHAPPVAAGWGAAEGAIGVNRLCPFELELASTCMASKLTQAGCEMATWKSKVLSNSVSVRAKLQLRLAPLGVQAARADRNLGIDLR